MTERLDERIAVMMSEVVDQAPPVPPLPTPPPRTAAMPRWAYGLAAAAAAFVVIGGAAILFGGSDGSAPPSGTSSTLPPSSTTTLMSTIATEPAMFRFATHDLCTFFTGDEILAFAAEAYRQEGLSYSVPEHLEATRNAGRPGNGCEWTVPGTTPGWGRDDFTVSLYDDSDVRFAVEGDTTDSGPTHLEDYHGAGIGYFSEIPEDHVVADLVRDGVVYLGGWSPGFGVYVPRADRILDVRHDLSAAVRIDEDPPEQYRVEMRILNAMLEKMGWIGPVPVSEAEADAAGFPFDAAVHDLCAWISTGEIVSIVTDAVAGQGVDWDMPESVTAVPYERRTSWVDPAPNACEWTAPQPRPPSEPFRLVVVPYGLVVDEESDMAGWIVDEDGAHDVWEAGIVGGPSWCHAGNEGSACEYFVWFDGRGGMALTFDTGSAYFSATHVDRDVDDNAAIAARIAEILAYQMRWIDDVNG